MYAVIIVVTALCRLFCPAVQVQVCYVLYALRLGVLYVCVWVI